MSKFSGLYRRGLVSMVTGPVALIVGLATGVRLLAVAGLIVLGWGIYRFIAARGTAR